MFLAFDEFWQGVQHLLSCGVPFIVKGAFLPQNTVDRDRFEEWAEKIPWMESRPSYSMCFDMRGRRDSPQKNKRISRLRANPREKLSILTRDDAEYRKEMKTFCARFMGSSGPLIFSCGAGDHVCIDAYGTIQPCLLLRMPEVCYNIRNGSLREALTEFFPRLKKISTDNPVYLNRCARCFIKGLCEQCPGRSWSEHGTLDTPVEYLCEVAHAQARHLGLIEPGEHAWEVRNGDERVRKFTESDTLNPA